MSLQITVAQIPLGNIGTSPIKTLDQPPFKFFASTFLERKVEKPYSKLTSHHLPQRREGVREAAERVDNAVFYRFVTLNNRTAIGCDLVGTHHQFTYHIRFCLGVRADKINDSLLHFTHITKGLRYTDDHAADADGMDGHGGAGHDEPRKTQCTIQATGRGVGRIQRLYE